MAIYKIILGRNIRDKVFEGNIYSQLASLRESVKAQDVVIDKLLSLVLQDHESIYTADDLAKAFVVLEECRSINAKVEELLPKVDEVQEEE